MPQGGPTPWPGVTRSSLPGLVVSCALDDNHTFPPVPGRRSGRGGPSGHAVRRLSGRDRAVGPCLLLLFPVPGTAPAAGRSSSNDHPRFGSRPAQPNVERLRPC